MSGGRNYRYHSSSSVTGRPVKPNRSTTTRLEEQVIKKLIALSSIAASIALAGCVPPPPPGQPVYAAPPPPPAKSPAPGPIPIPPRIENQEQRIDVDLRDGRMGPGQAAEARRNLRSIRGEYDRFLRVTGGNLTEGQFVEINRRLDNTLRFIESRERR